MKKIKIILPIFSAFLFLIVALSIYIYRFNLDSKKSSQTVSYNQVYETKDTLDIIENSINSSTGAAEAEFISFSQEDIYFIFKFKVIEVIYGNIPEKELEFRVETEVDGVAKNGFTSETFTEGERYFIPLLRFDDVFYEKAQYYFKCSIPLAFDKLSEFYSENEIYSGDIKSYIKELANKIGYQKEEVKNFFRDESLDTVIKNCDLVIKIKVISILTEGIYNNTTTYSCEVLNTFDFTNINTDTETDYLYITALKDSLKTDEEYIIALAIVDESSTIYTQASENGIIHSSDKEKVEQIKLWLSE